MRRRTKIAVGLIAVLALVVGFGFYRWYTMEPRPIIVAAPGANGVRVMIGDAPANFYAAADAGTRPGIVLLGGAEGGLKKIRNAYARQLAMEGYHVLYVSYFETRDDNRALDRVPLEIFDNAVTWLRKRPDVDPEKIAVIGHSKGAEAALLVASQDTRIAAVVAAMPSDVVWQGFSFNTSDMSQFGSSWTRHGEELSYVRYIVPPWYEWLSGGMGTLATMYRQSWDARRRYPGSDIPIRDIVAPILMVCGGRDSVWPSCLMARAARDRARITELLEYPEAGHWAFGPATGLEDSDKAYLGQMGGSADADLAARSDQWARVLRFLAANLK